MTRAEKQQKINEICTPQKITMYATKFARLAWLLENWNENSYLQKLSALSEIMNVSGQAHREFAGLVAICDFIDNR